MKHYLYSNAKFSLALLGLVLSTNIAVSQCTPQGDQTTAGTNNTWIGYVFQGKNFDTYKGYINEGSAASPDFDESFGGTQVNYATNGCDVYTDEFSVRYKLTKTLNAGTYTFTVGGDDGYRFSYDGGVTWHINNWGDHSYTTSTYTVTLPAGDYNLVLEYYENLIDNRVSFGVTTPCIATGDPAIYGSSNTWIGYVYTGMNFDTYKGFVTEGSGSSMDFDEGFGGDNVNYATSGCAVNTNQFSVRYRLHKTFADGTYTFTVSGDDGYRLSLDGGTTWPVNKWADQSYATSTYTTMLNGDRDLVLEYYENGGDNRISISTDFAPAAVLPIRLINWSAVLSGDKAQLKWKTAAAVNFSHFLVQRSIDGASFQNIKTISYPEGNSGAEHNFSYNDNYSVSSDIFYRLAMVDIDGKIQYSEIIRLSANSTFSGLRLYPTVVENGSIFIESGREISHARLEIYSMSGTKVGQAQLSLVNGRQQVNLGSSFSNVSTGSYVVLLSDSNGQIAKKVIFIK